MAEGTLARWTFSQRSSLIHSFTHSLQIFTHSLQIHRNRPLKHKKPSFSWGKRRYGEDTVARWAFFPLFSLTHSFDHSNEHTCTHAYMHTCTHAYMHICMYAYMHTCMHAYMHTCIHAHLHVCTHIYMHTSCNYDNFVHTLCDVYSKS